MMSDLCTGSLSPGGGEEDLMGELLQVETQVNPGGIQQCSLRLRQASWDFMSFWPFELQKSCTFDSLVFFRLWPFSDLTSSLRIWCNGIQHVIRAATCSRWIVKQHKKKQCFLLLHFSRQNLGFGLLINQDKTSLWALETLMSTVFVEYNELIH